MNTNNKHKVATISANSFQKKFLILIVLTWIVPAIIGMSFLLYINMFTWEQLLAIQTKPLEPLFVTVFLAFAYWYFKRFVQPICHYLANERQLTDSASVLNTMRIFPLHYWSLFLLYLLMAPTVVITSAEMYTDFVANPTDWFRIHLVALIVSIIVGLPIFFIILDLFGQALGDIKIKKAQVTLKTKVFLIGALTPLLIDTMLVQYYWTRTGYFTEETFVVWLTLEVLAVAGSLIFVHSFRQSLAPFQRFIGSSKAPLNEQLSYLAPKSTDELGVLSVDYRDLLEDLQIKTEILEINNRLLRDTSKDKNFAEVATTIVQICEHAVNSDTVFLILHDAKTNELVGIAQTGVGYDAQGHYRLGLDDISLSVMAFNEAKIFVIDDVPNDPRCNPEMIKRFSVQSAAAAPLVAEGKTIGVLLSACVKQPHHYSKREVALLEGLAREAAIAIHTQQLSEQRETALRALEQSEKMLQLVLNSIPTRVFWKDNNSVYLGCNNLFAKDAGVESTDEIVGKTDHQLIWSGQADFYEADDRQVISNGIVKTFYQEPQTTPDGKLVWRETSKVPLTDAQNNIIGILGTYHDITERKKISEELHQYRERLEELVQERTVELTAVNQELEAFSYSVSHDLRAPLRAIDGFSLAVIEDYSGQLETVGKQYLQRVRNSAQHMSKIIDDLLMLSRVTRSELLRESVNMSAMASDIIEKLQKYNPQRQVTVQIQSDLEANVSPTLIMFALDNLLGNAWKYTAKRDQATIEFGANTNDGEKVFYIKDNGVGFDMAYVHKIFSPFQRLHRDDEFEGTGIGLATVRRVIQRHGGRVWADSKVNEGATFYFCVDTQKENEQTQLI